MFLRGVHTRYLPHGAWCGGFSSYRLMRATFIAVLVVSGASLVGCRPRSAPPTGHAEDMVEKTVARHLITGYFLKKELALQHGAFFLIVPPEREGRLAGFMADFRPRVELGDRNMIREKSERVVLRDALTGLPSVLVHVSVPKVDGSEATVEAFTEGPGGGAYYTFTLGHTTKGWVISKETGVFP